MSAAAATPSISTTEDLFSSLFPDLPRLADKAGKPAKLPAVPAATIPATAAAKAAPDLPAPEASAEGIPSANPAVAFSSSPSLPAASPPSCAAPDSRPAPETLHPSLWLASQLARASGQCVDTGYPALSKELPGGGWPLGGLIEILLPQAGIGELRLLRPALRELAARRIVLLQPPYVPQAVAFDTLGVPSTQILWLRSKQQADSLWAAEQVLQSGSCGVLLFWQNHIRTDALRRLHLAAQNSNSLFCLLRPLEVAQDASPAQLRLSLKPMQRNGVAGVLVDVLKRRGPSCAAPIFLPLQANPGLLQRHATVDRTLSFTTATGSVLPTLVTAGQSR